MRKPVVNLLLCAAFLNPPAYAQDAIEIEIDSAPVEIEIQQPAPGAQEETPATQTAEIPQPPEESAETGGVGVLGITLGVVVAGALAALAGGGGGSGGGTSTTPSH